MLKWKEKKRENERCGTRVSRVSRCVNNQANCPTLPEASQLTLIENFLVNWWNGRNWNTKWNWHCNCNGLPSENRQNQLTGWRELLRYFNCSCQMNPWIPIHWDVAMPYLISSSTSMFFHCFFFFFQFFNFFRLVSSRLVELTHRISLHLATAFVFIGSF